MNKIPLIFVLFCATVLLVTAEVYVSSLSACLLCLGSEDSPYSTIQAGVDNVQSDGEVRILSGVYSGEDNININLTSAWIHFIGDGSATTIIDCANQGYGIHLISGTFYLTGITIRNCFRDARNVNETGGGALRIENTYTVLTDVIIQNSFATGPGGAVYIYSNEVEIYNSSVTNSTSNELGGGVFIQSANMKAFNSSLNNNKVNGTSNDIFCQSGSVEADKYSRLSSGTCVSCSITVNGTEVCPSQGGGTGDATSLHVRSPFLFLAVLAFWIF